MMERNYKPIILASGSPRRAEILAEHGVPLVVIPSSADETLPEGGENAPVSEIVMYLAELKARSVYEMLLGETKHCGELLPRYILGADTVVYKGHVIGKPVDEADAFSILSELRDATHEVWSGVSIIDRQIGLADTFSDVTYVTFADYPDEEIRRFIREEKPYDKSGSYAIQSSWSRNVIGTEGSIYNVIGLPWEAVEPRLP
jgi:septum formation protein